MNGWIRLNKNALPPWKRNWISLPDIFCWRHWPSNIKVHLTSQYLLLLKQFFGRSKGTNYFLLAHRFVVLHQVFVEKHLFALRFKVSANHVGSVSVIAKIRERVAQTSHFAEGKYKQEFTFLGCGHLIFKQNPKMCISWYSFFLLQRFLPLQFEFQCPI